MHMFDDEIETLYPKYSARDEVGTLKNTSQIYLDESRGRAGRGMRTHKALMKFETKSINACVCVRVRAIGVRE